MCFRTKTSFFFNDSIRFSIDQKNLWLAPIFSKFSCRKQFSIENWNLGWHLSSNFLKTQFLVKRYLIVISIVNASWRYYRWNKKKNYEQHMYVFTHHTDKTVQNLWAAIQKTTNQTFFGCNGIQIQRMVVSFLGSFQVYEKIKN